MKAGGPRPALRRGREIRRVGLGPPPRDPAHCRHAPQRPLHLYPEPPPQPDRGAGVRRLPGIETASAGLGNDADVPVSPELLAWADVVFVMEKAHRNRLSAKFKRDLDGKRVICLDIPDKYEYMDPDLVRLLKQKVSRFLPAA
jgi:predicted protein tyrosine phosphatase